MAAGTRAKATTRKAPSTRKASTRKAPAKEESSESTEPQLSHDTRQVNRRSLRRGDLDKGRDVQPRHTAGTGHAGGKTVAERVDSGEDVGTQKVTKPSLSTSQPLAEGTQLFITGKHFPSRVPATVDIKGPFRDERRSARTDPFGNVQIGLHNPDAGKHSVTVKAGGRTAKIAFETVGRNA